MWPGWGKDAARGSGGPSVIRVQGGELDYSDTDRKAVMVGGAMGTVVAETGTATSVSNQVDLYLVPAGKACERGRQGASGSHEESGHVVLTSQAGRDRRTVDLCKCDRGVCADGTASTPPRITDAVRGNATGEA